MSTPAQKLKWDDLDPADTAAAEANAVAARNRVHSAVKEDKAATRAGTQAGMGYKLSWDDLTPVGGQPSRATASPAARQPLAWNPSGDTSPINRAPRSAVRPAATADANDGLAQPGATFAHKPTDILTYEPKAADIIAGQRGPAYPEREVPWSSPLHRAPRSAPTFAEDSSRRRGRQARALQQEAEGREVQAQSDRIRQTTRGMVRSLIGAAAGVPATVIPDVVTETAADFGGGLTSAVGSMVSGESKPSVFNPVKSLALQIPGVQGVMDNTVGRAGQTLQEAGGDISEQAGAPDGVRRDIGRAAGGLLPILAARNPLAVGAVAYDEAKGQGADEQTAIEHGLTSAATVGAMGGAAKVINRAVPEAGAAAGLTRFGMRAAANTSAVPLIEAPGKLLRGENAIPTDREKANAAVMGTGFAALPHPVAEKPRVVRTPLALPPAPPEAVTAQARGPFAVSPAGEAVSTQPVARAPRLEPIPTQPLPLNRYQQRAQGSGRLETAPTSPAPSQAAQRGDFETGLEGMTARFASSEPPLKPAPATKSATTPTVENQSDQSTRADVAAPNYAVGDHLTSPTGKTFRVEAVSGDQTHVRAINRNGKPTGRTIPLRPDDVAQFEQAEAKPITVRAVSGPRTVNPETHSLTDAIAILGFDGTTAEGKDLAAYVQKRPGTINNTRLANGEKRGIDNYLIPALQDLGYDVADANDLLDKVTSQKPVYSQHYYEAQGEREIQTHLAAEHQAWLDEKPDSLGHSESDILFRAGKSPEFVGLLNRLHDPNATAEDEARFYEEATQHQKLPDDLATQLIETATSKRTEQGINQHDVRDTAQPAAKADESGQRPQERGTVRDAAAKEGDVDGISNASLDETTPRQTLAPREATAGIPTTDNLSRVQSIFDALKDESRTTGRRLQDIVEDRINQQALPGMESAALSSDDAILLRQMATRAPNRPPVAETQQGLLDVAPTLESKATNAIAQEQTQSAAVAHSPLFEGTAHAAIVPEPFTWEYAERKLRIEESVPGKILVRDVEQPNRAKSFTPQEFERQFGKSVQQAQVEAEPPHYSNFQPRDTDSGQFVEGNPEQPAERQALIERIVQAARDQLPDIREVYELKGDNGKWYRSGGFPFGVKFNGEKRSIGFAFYDKNGVGQGRLEPTRQELADKFNASQDRSAEDFRRILTDSTDEQLQSQADYWTKDAEPPPPVVAEKPTKQAKSLGTGSPEGDARLAEYRARKKSGRSMTANQEKALAVYEEQAAADPSKWKNGDGVGWKVGVGKGGQINRGFRVVDVDADTKTAVIRQVADTGITSTGGDYDRIANRRVHIADLVRDNKYNAPHPSQTQTRDTDGTFTVDKPKVEAFHKQLLESGESVDQYLSQPDLFADDLTDGEREHLRSLGEPARQAIAEHGQFARFLFHASERGKGDAFLNDSAVKKALALPDSANLTTVHNKLRADLGMETNKKVSPESLYGWAADKQLPHEAVEKIARAHKSALGLADSLAARKATEGGFLRLPSGREVRKAGRVLMDKQTWLDIANVPRALKASMDLSAPLRQGAVFSLTEPRLSLRAGRDMLKALLASKDGYTRLQEDIDAHPDYIDAQQAGVDFTGNVREFGGREEAFMSRFAGSIPGVRHSEQAYVTFLNSQRLYAYSKFAEQLRAAGKDFNTDPKPFYDIARFINAATGRGDVGRLADNTKALLNTVFFSPRYIASRVQVLNPREYYQMDSAARKIAMKKMFEYSAAVGTAMGLAALAGAKVGMNPDDSDFGKIVVGNTRYDATAGFAQYLRFTYNLASDFKSGEVKKAVDTTMRFARSKLAPVPGAAVNLYTGKDFAGQPVTILPESIYQRGQLVDQIVPLIVSDALDGWKDAGALGIAKTVPASMVGIGVGTYKKAEQPKRTGDEQQVHDAYRAANPLPPMTPLQKTKFDAKKEIETAIQRGDPQTSDIIKRNVDAGLVNDDEVFDIAAAAHRSGEEKMVEEFKKTPSVERKLDVFMKLSKPTRDKLRDELEDAWADSAARLTPHERAVLGPRVGQAVAGQ